MEKNKIKIVFFGTSEFSEIILDSLIKADYDIAGVFTRPDQKIGRKQELQKTSVRILAEKNNLPVFVPEKLDDAAVKELKKISPDLIITAAYGKIIPQKVLDIPKFGALNVHPSLLPKFRGPSPIQNVLLAGEKETGTTIMLMDAGMDSGDILSQKKIAIESEEKLPELSQKLARLSAKLLSETLPLWLEEKIKPQKQTESAATFCQLISRQEGKINWHEEAQKIYNKYRAFYPWPGVFTIWNGKRIKLNKIKLANHAEIKKQTGEVFLLDNGLAIQTGQGTIILEELQMEGKSNLNAGAFLNGYKNFIGSIL